MQTTDYLSNDVKVLRLDQSVNDLKLLFNESIFTHIPIVENLDLIGLLAESDIQNFEDGDKKIIDLKHLFRSFYAYEHANWFDLLKDFATNDANIIPVINKDKKYLGYYELGDILHFFNNTPFLRENGTILVISKNKDHYSLSEVSQIIERNNARLFGAFISKIEGDQIQVTIKLNTQNINEIIQTFRRYEYNIELDIKEDDYLNDLKERSEYLQKYLNI